MPKTIVADASYGSEENNVYAVGDEKEPRFDFLFHMFPIYKSKHANTKMISKMRKTGPVKNKMTILFARMEGKLRLKNTKIKRIDPVMNKVSKYTNVKIVQVSH